MNPTFNRVQVEPLETDKVGSIVIAQDRSAFTKGRVVAAGPMAGTRDGKRYHRFKKGDVVFYPKNVAIELMDSGKKITVVDDNQLLTTSGD